MDSAVDDELCHASGLLLLPLHSPAPTLHPATNPELCHTTEGYHSDPAFGNIHPELCR
jgi:hypothetical protein